MAKLFLLTKNGMQEFVPSNSKQNKNDVEISFFEKLKEELSLSKEDVKQDVNLYTISKLISIFDTTRPTIYSWIDMGLLKPIKLGGRVYFNQTDVEELIKQKTSENL